MKIYSVIFNSYTDHGNTSVSNSEGNYITISDPFLIAEDQIMEIHKYGKGINKLKYLGNLYNPDNSCGLEGTD